MQDANAARLLTETQVSAQYGLGIRMLRSMRMRNTGPRYVKVSGRLGASGGRILYPRHAVEEWIDSRPSGGGAVIETRPLLAVRETR